MFPWIFIWAPNISPHFYWWIDSSNESLVRAIQFQKHTQEFAEQVNITAAKLIEATSSLSEARKRVRELQSDQG